MPWTVHIQDKAFISFIPYRQRVNITGPYIKKEMLITFFATHSIKSSEKLHASTNVNTQHIIAEYMAYDSNTSLISAYGL